MRKIRFTFKDYEVRTPRQFLLGKGLLLCGLLFRETACIFNIRHFWWILTCLQSSKRKYITTKRFFSLYFIFSLSVSYFQHFLKNLNQMHSEYYLFYRWVSSNLQIF